MRQIIAMLQELAVTNYPRKEKTYRQAYPLIDASLGSGLDPRGSGVGPLNAVQLAEVMTASDFPFVIGEFVNRAMWPAYTQWRYNFEPLVFNDTLTNFMTHTRYQRQEELDDLEMVRPNNPARAGYLADAYKREYRVYRWEKQWDLEYEALVNDDLGYFRDFATMMGRSARRTIEKFVSTLYFNATTIAALVALGALYSGTARLSTNALMVAWHAFSQRTDGRGEPLVTGGPVYLVIHRGLELTARQILRSVQVAENATNAVNVLPPLEIIVDPYLTGTAPNLPWFLFVRPDTSGIRTVTLARMNGVPGPRILQKTPNQSTFATFGALGAAVPGLGDFDTGNFSVKAADIWGGWADATYSGVTDYRGIYYSSGTTG